MIDFKAPFYSAKNIFVEIHCEGQEKEAAMALATPLKWPFETTFYAFILHDRDINENGEKKPSHYHLFAETNTKQGKVKWLDALQKVFPFLPREALTVSAVQSERSCLRYLVHRDNPEKWQYDTEEVYTSAKKRFERAFEEVKDSNPSWDTIASWKSEEDIYQTVGLSNYHKAKEVWRDTQNAIERDFEIKELEERIKGYCDLEKDFINDLKHLQNMVSDHVKKGEKLPPIFSEFSKEIYHLIKKWKRE